MNYMLLPSPAETTAGQLLFYPLPTTAIEKMQLQYTYTCSRILQRAYVLCKKTVPESKELQFKQTIDRYTSKR